MDTAITGTGDHENYFAQLDLDAYIRNHDGHLLNANCEAKAIRIRAVSGHIMWPSIPKTTLLFSDKKTYSEETVVLDDVDTNDFNFYASVKPHYG